MKPVIYNGVEIGEIHKNIDYRLNDGSLKDNGYRWVFGERYSSCITEAEAEAACIEAARREWERLNPAFGGCMGCKHYMDEYADLTCHYCKREMKDNYKLKGADK